MHLNSNASCKNKLIQFHGLPEVIVTIQAE